MDIFFKFHIFVEVLVLGHNMDNEILDLVAVFHRAHMYDPFMYEIFKLIFSYKHESSAGYA